MKYVLFGKLRSPKVVVPEDLLPTHWIKGIIKTWPFEFAFETFCKQNRKAVEPKEAHITYKKLLVPIQRDVNFMKRPNIIGHEASMNEVGAGKSGFVSNPYVLPNRFKRRREDEAFREFGTRKAIRDFRNCPPK